MLVWTAQYRYPGGDRLDITTRNKEQPGAAFSPGWPLVAGFREGRVTENQYTHQYVELMRKSWEDYQSSWQWILSQSNVTLVCFCPADTFCHRVILGSGILGTHFENATYMGERIPPAGGW